MYSKTPGCFWSPYQNIIGKFGASDNKKCGAYPQEDFLFIKLITFIRINLLNNCKKLNFVHQILNF
jgi:hypothetical protein